MKEPQLKKWEIGHVQELETPSKVPDNEESDESLTCGLGKYRPKRLQIFNNSKVLLVLLCAFACVQGFVVNGINNVNTTSYERRFGLPSSTVGFISSSYDISAGILVLPISYYALRGHKTKMLSIGLATMALGSFCMALPHFTTGRYESGQSQTSLCSHGNISACEQGGSGLSNYLYVLIGGQLLHGAGGTTLYTVGVACIDDNVVGRTSALFVALLYSFAAIGPAIGYVLGGYFLNVYVDFDTIDIDTVSLTNLDPRWVGAWWPGFVIAMFLAVVLIIPMLALPRELPSAKEVRAHRVSEAHSSVSQNDLGNSVKDAPKVLWSMLRNPTLICIALAASSDGIVQSGFATFIPKFIQNQYGQTASFSAMLTGFLVIPGAVCGQVIGGFICRRFSLKIRGMLRLSLISCFISLATAAGFWARCPQDKITGVNTNYPESTFTFTSNLTSECNAQCHCVQDNYSPICGTDGLQYFSPCHAGCSANEGENYFNCSCINGTLSTGNLSQSAENGNCNASCPMMYVFLCTFFFTVLFTFISATPATMVVLRCVPESQKSFAIGVQWAFVRFLGTIPGPILFGTVIDSVCLVWKEKCGERSSCWIYNTNAMGRNNFLLGIGIKTVSFTFFLLSWLVYKPPPGVDSDKGVKYEVEISEKGDNSRANGSTMIMKDGVINSGENPNTDIGTGNPLENVLY